MKVPQHIAIILDGNGRWAKAKGMPRNYGHAQGSKNVERICEEAWRMGIKYLTVYAFSTENWSRPESEVTALMKLLRNYMKTCLKTAAKNDMKIRVIGDIEPLDDDIKSRIRELESATVNNGGLNFTIALNYGSRDEIVRASRRMAKDCAEGRLDPDSIDETVFESYLDTHGIPDPVTGVPVDVLEIEKDWLGPSNVAPQILLREGGSLTDLYVNHLIARDLNGNVKVDNGAISMEEVEPFKVGSLDPKANLGWSNTFGYKGLSLGIVITARIGGLVYSATQGILDYYGASEASAQMRDNGGIPVNYGTLDARSYYTTISTATGGHGAYYLYDATNVRLQELTLNYTFPKKWFNDKLGLTVGFVARNLAMIYCKAPFDPELSAATGSNYYQGVDYFMLPSTRNFGFNVRLQF